DLRLDQVELLGQRRVLDMRQGVLLREWRVRDRAGRVTSLRSLRFASLDNRHALVQLIMIMPQNYSGRIALESVVDGRVTNDNPPRHLVALPPSPSPAAAGEGSESSAPSPAAARGGRGFSSPPLPSQQERGPGGQGLLLMRTLRSGYELAFAAH